MIAPENAAVTLNLSQGLTSHSGSKMLKRVQHDEMGDVK